MAVAFLPRQLFGARWVSRPPAIAPQDNSAPAFRAGSDTHSEMRYTRLQAGAVVVVLIMAMWFWAHPARASAGVRPFDLDGPNKLSGEALNAALANNIATLKVDNVTYTIDPPAKMWKSSGDSGGCEEFDGRRAGRGNCMLHFSTAYRYCNTNAACLGVLAPDEASQWGKKYPDMGQPIMAPPTPSTWTSGVGNVTFLRKPI